jgi:hypothetical protein
MDQLPCEIKMYINRFVGNPTATMIKACEPRKYPKRFWIKYEKWLLEWHDYNVSQYECDYWAMKYHQCCTSDMHHLELRYGIIPYVEK